MTTPEPGSFAEYLHSQAVENRDRTVEGWITRARFAQESRELGELLPAWSTGELLAVAVINDDTALFEELDYTREQALERIRFDIGATPEVAEEIIRDIRAQL
ncbi:hypothetical protein P3H15_52120 [Rhodococcus sp. T2V]|uniref:hypothetical protein n=1 Tax=Rhodococcus sp. T2V TaxID=3034164 RepID=UPI0023E2F87D|nr:hypothetical protein [Rhodococcus sp. T2V]MDF3313453.1 hypothetical protein [Rhodococcus sp. T2V]